MSIYENRDFSEALISLKNGRKIKRGVKSYRLCKNDMDNDILLMEYPVNGFTFEDMMSEDWEIVDE